MAEAENRVPLIENFNVGSGGNALVVGQMLGNIYLQIQAPRSDAQRMRLLVLKSVCENWIEGVLHQFLYRAARIDLNLLDRADVVMFPPQTVVRVPDWQPVPIPPEAGIAEVFDRLGRAMLISGASGVGKSTLMLELCERLVERALEDERNPIPVVFHLSAWAVKRKPLAVWMMEELVRLRVEKELAQRWLNTGEIVPLLDGLDEVAADKRGACLNAINEFRGRWPLCSIVVCSRTADLALGQSLRLRGTVTVRPLTEAQVDEQLERNPELLPLSRAKGEDPFLAELLATPLVLWMASRAYKDTPLPLIKEESLEQTRQRLFSSFAWTQVNGGAEVVRFKRVDLVHWLSRLAVGLERNERRIFYLEDLSPEWFVAPKRRSAVRLEIGFGYMVACGLVLGLIGSAMGWFFGGFDYSGHYAVRSGWGDGFWSGFWWGMLFGLVSSFTEMRPMEAFSIRFVRERWRIRKAIRSAAIFGAASSPLFVSMAAIAGWVVMKFLGGSMSDLRGMVMVSLMLGLAIGVVAGVANLVATERIDLRRRPNQGTYSSIRNALSILAALALAGLLVGGMFGLVGGFATWKILPEFSNLMTLEIDGKRTVLSGMKAVEAAGGFWGVLRLGLLWGGVNGLRVGMIAGLFGAMIWGGAFAIRHFVTRIVAWLNRETPLAYASFLDFAVDRLILLRQREGGYLFAHETLLRYFMSIEGADITGAAMD